MVEKCRENEFKGDIEVDFERDLDMRTSQFLNLWVLRAVEFVTRRVLWHCFPAACLSFWA